MAIGRNFDTYKNRPHGFSKQLMDTAEMVDADRQRVSGENDFLTVRLSDGVVSDRDLAEANQVVSLMQAEASGLDEKANKPKFDQAQRALRAALFLQNEINARLSTQNQRDPGITARENRKDGWRPAQAPVVGPSVYQTPPYVPEGQRPLDSREAMQLLGAVVRLVKDAERNARAREREEIIRRRDGR